MGVKSNLAGIVPTPQHLASAAGLGRNVQAMLAGVSDSVTDAVYKMKQVIADCPLGVSGAAVNLGGTGYAVGNTLNFAGGVVLTVSTVASGGITAVTVTDPGSVPAGIQPPNPARQTATSGSGTGASFVFTWAPVDANLASFTAAISALS